jgi:hypothetical protein
MSQQEALNRHRTIAALYQSKTAGMDSSDTPKAGNGPRPIPPLVVSIELLANLIYLSRRTETHSAQQHYYLDWATSVIEELSHHPNLHECAENRRQGCLGNDLTRHRDARFPNQRGAKRLSSGPPEELKDQRTAHPIWGCGGRCGRQSGRRKPLAYVLQIILGQPLWLRNPDRCWPGSAPGGAASGQPLSTPDAQRPC